MAPSWLNRKPVDYRPDIDGLRAIAVLGVLFYHIKNEWLPGGYVGVDVFFVISGFLITRNIWAEMRAGCFTLGGFYLRRIRRIAPASLVVTLFTLCAGALLLQPEDMERLARSAIWTALSAANIYFWKYLDTDYFAESSDQEPLLHMWSLGVEEQFYLLWPALVLVAALAGRRKLIAVTVVIGIVSFVWGELTNTSAAKFSYFMLPTRAGELMVGAVLALTGDKASRTSSRAWPWAPREGFALTGLALLGYALWFLDNDRPFPGLNALFPCAGAALLIFAGGSGSRLCQVLLGNRAIVFVGLISFSLYLWHWPFLAFIRYFHVVVSPVLAVVAVGFTMALSVTTYRWVELPARRWRAPGWKQVGLLLALPVTALVGLSVFAVRSHELQSLIGGVHHHQAVALQRQTQAVSKLDYPCQTSRPTPSMFLGTECLVGVPSTAPSITLWGDSNAGHYIGVLRGVLERAGTSFRYLAVPTCPPVFGPGAFGAEYSRSSCRRARDGFRNAQADAPTRTIVLAAQWSVHDRNPAFGSALRSTIQELQRNGSRVILLAQVPLFPEFGRECDLRWTRIGGGDCATRAAIPEAGPSRVNIKIAQIATETGAEWLDPRSMLCEKGSCSPYLNGRPIYYNESHLSRDGAYQLGTKIADSELYEAWVSALLPDRGARAGLVLPAPQPAATKFAHGARLLNLPAGYRPPFPYTLRSARHEPSGAGRYRHVVILEYLEDLSAEALGIELTRGLRSSGLRVEGPSHHKDGLRYVARGNGVYLTVDVRPRPDGVLLKTPGARGILYFGWKDASPNGSVR